MKPRVSAIRCLVLLVILARLSLPSVPPAEAQATAELLVRKMTVMRQPAGSAEPEVVPKAEPQPMEVGDSVTVDGLGEAQLQLQSGGRLTLFHDTRLRLQELGDSTGVVAMTEGALLVPPQPLGTVIRVETPNAQVETAGEALVYFSPTDQVTWVLARTGQARIEAGGQVATVAAGQQTWVEGDGSPVAPQPATRKETADRFLLLDDLTNGALSDEAWLGPAVEPLASPAVPDWLLVLTAIGLLGILVLALATAVRGKRRPAAARRRSPRANLRVGLPDGSTRVVALDPNPLTIGRAPDNRLQLKDDRVSSHHARLTPVQTGYQLDDLGSTNGTQVNGQPISSALLRGGERIQMGKVWMVLEIQPGQEVAK